MVDVAITAANVKKGAGAKVETGVAGATITAGQLVYLNQGTSKYLIADNDSVAVGANESRGFALHAALDNQPLQVQYAGEITLNGLTPGATYFLSNTPGGLCPDADVGAGEKVMLVGVAKSATVLKIDPVFPGVTR